jgi:hypothetical protein
VHLCLESRPTDRSSYLYCLSNPKILIRGGVLRVGSDPIPAVKVLPDPAHLPLKLECLSRGGYPRNREVWSGMWNVIGDGWWLWNKFCIRWWAQPVRKLFLLLAPGYSIESKAYQRIKVPIRARAQTGESRTSWSKAPLFWIMRKTFQNSIKSIENLIIC